MGFFINKIIIAAVLLWLAYGSYVFYRKMSELKTKSEDEKSTSKSKHWSDF